MLKDAIVISLARNFWDEVWRSRHHVMSRLARTNTVVFASRPLTVQESLASPGTRPPLRRAGAHPVNGGVWAYVPPRHLPTVHRMHVLERILERQRREHLRRFVDQWKGRPQVVYLWHPEFERYLDAFADSLVCYHLFDDLSLYGDKEEPATAMALERIFARADLVFVASEELADRYRRFGNVHWIPNGVDYDAYASTDAPRASPPDLAAVPRPRLGYAGTLRAQIDLDLLIRLTSARPEWALVLIGDCSRSVVESAQYQTLRSLPNVYSLGPKAMRDVPSYLAHLDVGLLPYRLDGAAQYCYPLKMHEYLAAGLPVVSSPISAVQPFGAVIRTAETVDGWVEVIVQSLEDRSAGRHAERRDIARQNSWDDRVDRISSLISASLADAGKAC